jgi:hypothetical protein
MRKRWSTHLVRLLMLGVPIGVPSIVSSAEPCAPCTSPGGAAPCADAGPQYVERTVYVPMRVTETRKVLSTEYTPEVREWKMIVLERVPEKQTVTKEITVMTPQTQTRTENYTVRKPVARTVTQDYTVSVPYQETRQATRTVCRPVTKDVT